MTDAFIYILVSSVMCSLCGLSVLPVIKRVNGISHRLKCNILLSALTVPYAGIFAAPFIPRTNSTSVIRTADTAAPVCIPVPAETAEYPVMTVPADAPTVYIGVNDIVNALAWVWFVVAVIMFIRAAVRHMRLTLILRRGRTLHSNAGRLPVYTERMNISPFLTGFLKPAIYVPADTYTDEELALVIAHETTHFKRGDLYRRLLITLLNCVNWFDPAYRYLLKQLSLQTEYACDEAVTRDMDDETSRSYGYMLLKTAENNSRYEYLSVGLGSDARDLKRRIGFIMKTNKKLSRNAKALTLGAFALSAVLCIGGCGAAVAAVEPQATQDNSEYWWSENYSVPSQVPEAVTVGRYYKIMGRPDEYIDVYPDGTIQMFGYDYMVSITELNGEDVINSKSEEAIQEMREYAEYWNSRHQYVYNPVLGFIHIKDPSPGEDADIEKSSLGFTVVNENIIAFDKSAGYIYRYVPVINDGCYRSEKDDSYLYISDGYIELVGYDIAAVLSQKWEEGVAQGFIDPERDSYEEFFNNSVKDFEESGGRRKYTVVVGAAPEYSVMLATEINETGSGGGSYSGYFLIDENTINAHGDNYIYSGERP